MGNERKDEKFKRRLVSLAKDLEMIRLEIYQNAVESEDKQELDNELFALQSKINYEISEMAYLLDYKE